MIGDHLGGGEVLGSTFSLYPIEGGSDFANATESLQSEAHDELEIHIFFLAGAIRGY